MRHNIHLLPDEAQRRAYAAARTPRHRDRLQSGARLSELRRGLLLATRVVVAGLDGCHWAWAERVREQTGLHLTFVQKIDPERRARGQALLETEYVGLLQSLRHCRRLAPIARDSDTGGRYRLAHRAPLEK